MNRIRTLANSMRRFVAVVLRQLANDRSALFFIIVLPVAVIVIIGATFGSGPSIEIGVVGARNSTAATAIVNTLDTATGVDVRSFSDEDELRAAVRRQSISAGLVFPQGFDNAVAGGTSVVTFVADPAGQGSQVARDVVVSAVARVLAPADAARFASQAAGVPYATALVAANSVASSLPETTVTAVDVGKRRATGLSQFSLTAPQNLVLFVFINAMAGGASLVRMRRTGVLQRVLAGPVGASTIVAGLMAAWFIVSLLQSILILLVGGLLFGVDWGDPTGVALLTVVFALVGCGAGLLVGALGGNEDRVSAISPPVGIALGALGGCMVPLEVFPNGMRAVAHVIPHYWAMTAWQRLIFDGDGLAGIAGPLAALTGFAIVFLTVAAFSLHRALIRP